ncbi:MAG: hypothetical protein K2I44_02440, partial [Muribaculaceae bacterium]|nr:hypothetical protein [Muribaculaceae bacterium]
PILQASVKAALGKFGAVPSIDFNADVLPVDPLPQGETPERPTLDIPENYNPFVEQQNSFMAKGYDFGMGTFQPAGANPFGGNTSSRTRKGVGGGNHYDGRVSKNWDSLYSDFIKDSGSLASASQISVSEEDIKEPASGQDSGPVSDENVFSGTVPSGGGAAVLPEMENVDSLSAICMQHAQSYIITSSREGLIIIDQHRAHVRILFEQYLSQMEQEGQVSQGVMFPETLILDPEYQHALEEVGDELSRLGFVIEYEEDNRWKIAAVPAMLKNADPKDMVLKILESVTEDGVNYGNEGNIAQSLPERLALVMARSSAISRGRRLSTDEMEHIVGELFSLPSPAYTPNGNRVYCLLDEGRLESMFR